MSVETPVDGQTLIIREIIYYRMAKVTKEDCLSIDEAVAETSLARPKLYTYMDVLNIQRFRFPRDRRTFIAKDDVERIKRQLQETGD